MAKKKKKRKKRNQPASSAGPVAEPPVTPVGKRLFQAGLAAVALVVVYFIWQSNQAGTAFDETAKLGQAGLSSVVTERDNGGGHPGRQVYYPDRFPTSGQHNPRWAETGFHEDPQNAGKLVHALEHGNVVIYYDKPGAETIALLKQWSSMFVGQWSGVVVAPAPGLGEEIVLSAWRKKLRMKSFVETTAAAFIDTFRGRGPENPVR